VNPTAVAAPDLSDYVHAEAQLERDAAAAGPSATMLSARLKISSGGVSLPCSHRRNSSSRTPSALAS
jgi:hypothetical protein